MAKVTKNLSLDEAAVARGERYSTLHDTNLSRLVSDFLAGLPLEEQAEPLPPTVRRLIGVATSTGVLDEEERGTKLYRGHLDTKYGDS